MFVCGYVYVNAGQRQVWFPSELDYKWLWASWHGYWESNLGSLQEEYVLLTTESILLPRSCPFEMQENWVYRLINSIKPE